MSKLLDGRALAMQIREGLRDEITQLTSCLGRAPGLAVVLVGDDAASQIYVRNKEKAAAAVGLISRVVRLPQDASEEDVLQTIQGLNRDESIDAFLVQLPLPSHLNEATITSAILPSKDADGLHPENLGKLVAGLAGPRPCTPSGVMALLRAGGVQVEGAKAVVVGRSTIVGKPMALMLLAEHATVLMCHSRTNELVKHVASADIVVAAVGQPKLITADWLQEGAAVVDVGINRIDGSLVGDVDFDSARCRAGCITPVPGGVGPMTVAMLLSNAVAAARHTAAQ